MYKILRGNPYSLEGANHTQGMHDNQEYFILDNHDFSAPKTVYISAVCNVQSEIDFDRRKMLKL